MITDYFMITEKSNRLQVIVITDYDYPNSGPHCLLLYNVLNLSVMLGIFWQQSTSAVDIFRCIFFLAL